MELIIHGLVSRSSVNECLFHGWPLLLLPDDCAFDLDSTEGGSRSMRGLRALIEVANEGQALVLASSSWDTDARRKTMGKVWYLLTPPGPHPHPTTSIISGPGDQVELEGGLRGRGGGGPAALLIRKVASRSMLLPLQTSLSDDKDLSLASLPTMQEMDKMKEALCEVRPFDPLDLDDGSMEGLVMDLARSSSKKPQPNLPAPLPPQPPASTSMAVQHPTGAGDKKEEGAGGAKRRSGGQAKLQLDPVASNKAHNKETTRKKGRREMPHKEMPHREMPH